MAKKRKLKRAKFVRKKSYEKFFFLGALLLAIITIIVLFNPNATTNPSGKVTMTNTLSKTAYEIEDIFEGQLEVQLQPPSGSSKRDDQLPFDTEIRIDILKKNLTYKCGTKDCQYNYLCPNGEIVEWHYCDTSTSTKKCKNVTYDAPPEYTGYPDKFCCFMNPENCIGDVTLSGNSIIRLNSARIIGTVNRVDGKTGFGKAINFTNTYIKLTSNSRLSGTGAFTVEALIKTGSSSNQAIIQQRGNGIEGEYMMWIDKGHIRFMTHKNNAGVDFTSNRAVNDNQWHHIAIVRNGRNHLIYIDGVLDNSTIGDAIELNSTLETVIGKDIQDNDKQFIGLIDEIRIWNIARTATQISNSKNAQLLGNETGLKSYYRFNEVSGNVVAEAPQKSTYTAKMVVDERDVTQDTNTRFNWGIEGMGTLSPSSTFKEKADFYALEPGKSNITVTGTYGERTGTAKKEVTVSVTYIVPPSQETPIVEKGRGGITAYTISTSSSCTERGKECCLINETGLGNWYGWQLTCAMGTCFDECTKPIEMTLQEFVSLVGEDVNVSNEQYYAVGKGWLGGSGLGYAYCTETDECTNDLKLNLEDMEIVVPSYIGDYIFLVNMSYNDRIQLSTARQEFSVGEAGTAPTCPDSDYTFTPGQWSSWSACSPQGKQTKTRTLYGVYEGSDNCPETRNKTETEERNCTYQSCIPDWQWQKCEPGEKQYKEDKKRCDPDNLIDFTTERDCCVEDWRCTEWSPCIDGQQTRSCEDIGNNGRPCETEFDKPPESQSCIVTEKPGTSIWIWIIVAAIVVIVMVILFVTKTIHFPSGGRGKPKAEEETEYSELVNYIRQAQSYGSSNQEIEQKLKDAGWPQDAIDKAFKAVK